MFNVCTVLLSIECKVACKTKGHKYIGLTCTCASSSCKRRYVPLKTYSWRSLNSCVAKANQCTSALTVKAYRSSHQDYEGSSPELSLHNRPSHSLLIGLVSSLVIRKFKIQLHM